MKRHIAKTSTDQRCVVVFMQIPGRESHALICPTDNLPPRLEQAVMDVLESDEGQADPTFANVLSRRLLPDTGENLMSALHTRGYLRPTPIDNVFMLPKPNMPFPLRQIIEQMGGTVPAAQTIQTQVDPVAATEKFNPYGQIKETEDTEGAISTAQNLIGQAEEMERQARLMKTKAYAIAPSLKPVDPAPVLEEKQVLTETAPKAERKSRARAAKN